MRDLTPLGRSRVAFSALCFALYLIESSRVIQTGGPTFLYLLTPFIAVVGVGHAPAREAMVRAALAVITFIAAALIFGVVRGRGVPDLTNLSALLTGATSLFALNLVIVFATSKLVEKAWPESDHWTH